LATARYHFVLPVDSEEARVIDRANGVAAQQLEARGQTWEYGPAFALICREWLKMRAAAGLSTPLPRGTGRRLLDL